MKPRELESIPDEQRAALSKARRLEIVMIIWQSTVLIVMYLAMGSSQMMKTALIDDALALFPPIVFLISLRVRRRPPDQTFPYGYSRASLLAFLGIAASILLVGVYTFWDSTMTLLFLERPTFGHYSLFGQHVWTGWVMIAALIYSMLPSIVLAPAKLRLARTLHEKSLHADAVMNKAEWMTSLAGIAGILGVGLGLWWADAAAALLIALDILKDGFGNLKVALADLMDRCPTDVDRSKPLALEKEIAETLAQFPEVQRHEVRLRESGNLIFGTVLVDLDGHEELADRLDEMTRKIAETDWRLQELTIMPVRLDGNH